MLTLPLIHPEIIAALAGAGHGSKVLIADGNYPASTAHNPSGKIVYLNLSPGIVTCTDVLKAVAAVQPVEAAEVMDPGEEEAQYKRGYPPIWDEFMRILKEKQFPGGLRKIERFSFYEEAMKHTNALTIVTGEKRTWANILLTIGVLKE